MNFKQLVLEALSPIKVIKKLTGRETMFHRLPSQLAVAVQERGGWLVHYDGERFLYFYDNDDPSDMFCICISKHASEFEEVSKEDKQAINDWEYKRNLSKDTIQTFGDLIDEL